MRCEKSEHYAVGRAIVVADNPEALDKHELEQTWEREMTEQKMENL